MTIIEIKPHRNGWKVFESLACVENQAFGTSRLTRKSS